MATDRRDDLRAFRGFIDAQLAGGAEMTPEEALRVLGFRKPVGRGA